MAGYYAEFDNRINRLVDERFKQRDEYEAERRRKEQSIEKEKPVIRQSSGAQHHQLQQTSQRELSTVSKLYEEKVKPVPAKPKQLKEKGFQASPNMLDVRVQTTMDLNSHPKAQKTPAAPPVKVEEEAIPKPQKGQHSAGDLAAKLATSEQKKVESNKKEGYHNLYERYKMIKDMKPDPPAPRRDSFGSVQQTSLQPKEVKQQIGIMKHEKGPNESKGEKRVQFDLGSPRVINA